MLDGLALPFIALSEIVRQADRSQESWPVALEEPVSGRPSRTGPFLSPIGRHKSKILVAWLLCPQGDRNDSHHRCRSKMFVAIIYSCLAVSFASPYVWLPTAGNLSIPAR